MSNMEPSCDTSKKGLVFNIQRFSVNDGPGVRTIAFLNGCPLRCKWCCNPESQELKPVVMFKAQNCVGCGNCEVVCPTGASNLNVPGKLIIQNVLHAENVLMSAIIGLLRCPVSG